MNKKEQFLKEKARAFFDSEIECFQYFVEDDLYVLYKMIEENISLDDWLEESSHVIEYFDDKFYYLEEEDLITYRDTFYNKGEENE